MAILNKIRSKGVFLIIIIALALFAFIIGDVIRNQGSSFSKQNTLASINGVDLDSEDFARKVEQQSQRFGSTGSNINAVNAVWNQEVSRVLLEEQYEQLGITVTEERLNELLKTALQNNATFQDESGFFSLAKMQEYLATIKQPGNETLYNSWITFEKSLENQEKQDIYYNLIKAGVGATLKDGEAAYRLDGNTVDIEFVQIPYTSVPDEDIEITKEEITAYINAHTDEYQTEGTRSIRFVKFEDKPTLDDENDIKAEIEELITRQKASNGLEDPGLKLIPTDQVFDFVAEHSDTPYVDQFVYKSQLPNEVKDTLYALETGDVYGPYKDGDYLKIQRLMETAQLPDSVRSRHILISYQGAQRSPEIRSKDDAQKLADSIFTVVKRNRSKFGELAAGFSSDASNKDTDGELTPVSYLARPNFAPAFGNFIFEEEEGDLDLVETSFGYHIIEILEQKNIQKVQKWATVSKEILPSNKTLGDVYNATQKFEIAAREGKFDEVGEASGYTVRPVNAMKPMDATLPGEGAQREIIRWAFDEESKVGDIKRFQVTNGHIVAQVTKRTKKGLEDATTASTKVTPILRNKKKAEIIKGKISGTDLSTIASDNSQQVKTAGAINMANPTIAGAGEEPKVVGAAFALNEGETSTPIEGDRGVYVIKITSKSEIANLDNYTPYAGQETQKARTGVTSKVIAALKEAADIEDNRVVFY